MATLLANPLRPEQSSYSNLMHCADMWRYILATHPHFMQDSYWANLSTSLVELSFTTDGPIHLAALNQLTNLTSLKVYREPQDRLREIEDVWTLNQPFLMSLHLAKITVTRLELMCPRLRSLTLYRCTARECLFLQAPFEELLCRGICRLTSLQGFSLSNLLGLTRLHYDMESSLQMNQDPIYETLPLMSELRSLDMVFGYRDRLPEQLPANLRTIRYLLRDQWNPGNLQTFASTCQLPELQSITLANRDSWDPRDMRLLIKARRKLKKFYSQTKISLREDYKIEDFIVMWGS